MNTDCFAFTLNCKGAPGCTVLTRTLCATGPCPFFKTEVQAAEDRRRAEARARGEGYYAGGVYVPGEGKG